MVMHMVYAIMINVTKWIHMHMVCAWKIYNGMRMYVNMKWEMAMYIYVVLVNVTEWIHMHMVCVWKIYNGMRTYMNMEWEMVMYMCMRNMNM